MNTTIFYSDIGSGEPIVLIHGSLSYAQETFSRQIDPFSRHYRCLCPDLPGHGRSKDIANNWTTATLAEEIYLWLSEIGIKKAHMVGHSMGGDIVMYLMLHHGELVRSAVSISSAGMVNDSIADFLYQLQSRNDPNRENCFLKRMIWNCTHYPDFADADLQNMKAPFLLIRGKQDPMVKDSEVQRLQNLIPHFSCEEFEGSHFLQGSRKSADAINECILGFANSY